MNHAGVKWLLFHLGDQGSDTCDQYISCASSVAPSELDAIIAAYGDDGSCWSEKDLDCDAACEQGLDDLSALGFGQRRQRLGDLWLNARHVAGSTRS